MKGFVTTYVGLFQHDVSSQAGISAVEIPDFQRDYAQGRAGGAVEEVRDRFLEVLLGAAAGGTPVGLDFVYGEVSDGTLRPLDGQQRLTTLFLLHWYLAFRSAQLPTDAGWTKFTYATRPSARRFCELLTGSPPPPDEDDPRAWIVDQPWYRYSWRHDPTIQSMLTMITAISERFDDVDATLAWERLTTSDAPAVTFHLLPIDDMGPVEVLYVTMNSRGKPLTDYEVFKARLEQVVSSADRARADTLARKMDGAWADLLWPLRGDDDVIDDEMLRYLAHVLEIAEWREGLVGEGRLAPRAEHLFSPTNVRAGEHLDLLETSFDVWPSAAHAAETFHSLFSTSRDAAESGKIRLFGARAEIDLWNRCLRTHGAATGAFPLGDSLLLHAIVQHQRQPVDEFPRRLRTLRNLVEASTDAVRRPNMPKLVAEAEHAVSTGELDLITTFSPAQVADEVRKRKFLDQYPELTGAVQRLEDHSILRGGLMAFEMEEDRFADQADAFDRVFEDPSRWTAVTGALLATGEYQRRRPGTDSFQFGTSKPDREGVWRQLFTGSSRDGLSGTRPVLAKFLDRVAGSDRSVDEVLTDIQGEFLRQRETERFFDWRYYLVRYESMRQGASGIYYGAGGQMGYDLAMLRRTRLSSYYRDPYLLATWLESGAAADPDEPVDDPWFYGYATESRWMTLRRSGVGLRFVGRGLEIRPPSIAAAHPTFTALIDSALSVHRTADGYLRAIEQAEVDGVLVDAENRVQAGARMLAACIAAGL